MMSLDNIEALKKLNEELSKNVKGLENIVTDIRDIIYGNSITKLDEIKKIIDDHIK